MMNIPATLTHREVPEFAKKLWNAMPERGPWELDLSTVKVIDSSFLALLLEALRKAELKGVSLRFLNLPVDARALMEGYGVFKLFEKNVP